MTKDWDNPRPTIPAETPAAIAELFKLLPAPGTDWPLFERVCFLNACAATFNVVYGSACDIKVVASSNHTMRGY